MAYPFAAVDPGTTVGIYHGSHGQLETRSPAYALVPYEVGGAPHPIAGCLCTPLVTFPADTFAAAAPITSHVAGERAGAPYEMVALH